MSSLLNNIKSRFSLKNIFDFLPYSTCLKMTKGNRKLQQQLQITIETYKQILEYKKIIKPSFDIQKYFSYFEIVPNDFKEENYLKEKIFCMSLNISKYSNYLSIQNKDWEYNIKNCFKNNFIISPNILFYLYYLNEDTKQKLYQILNLYKNNITEITICYFNNNDWILKIEIINQIIEILENIFGHHKKDKNDDNINNSINNINPNINVQNKNHNVTKICFDFNEIPPDIDIITKFFHKIDNILNLKKIKELIIDATSFDEIRFTKIINFISNKMPFLKEFKINSCAFSRSNYADMNVLFTNTNETIEKLDLSESLCSSDIISVLNNKKYPLKEVKLNLYSNDGKINWLFLENNIYSLEAFEIKIQENNNYYSIKNMIFILNKMTKLKHLKLTGCLKLNLLKYFNENDNLDYLNIDFLIREKNPNEIMTDFLKNFKNLKSLILYGKGNLTLNNFIFPRNLKFTELINFRGSDLISLLSNNKEQLFNIEEFKIEMINFNYYSEFIQLFESFKFKNIKHLSLNKIFFNSFYLNFFNVEKISLFLKNNPSLIELDIRNNNHWPKDLKENIYKIIKSSMPKKLLNLKIFNNDYITENQLISLKNYFGFALDLNDVILI